MEQWEWNLLEDKALLDHVEIAGTVMKKGDRVRLNPKTGGDILDIALRGQMRNCRKHRRGLRRRAARLRGA